MNYYDHRLPCRRHLRTNIDGPRRAIPVLVPIEERCRYSLVGLSRDAEGNRVQAWEHGVSPQYTVVVGQ